MSFQVLTNCKIYLDAYDISGNSNKIDLKYGAESLDNTTFGSTYKSRQAGLCSADVQIDGFYEVDATSAATYKIDDIVDANFGVTGKLLTICPTTGAQGEVAFMVPSMIGEYNIGASVGEILPFTFSGQNTDVLARGTVMENAAKTSTANGTARQLGATSATQKVYAGLHILAASGTNPTLDVKIQSATVEGFGTPVDRITFAQATAIGSQWATAISGPITETWWRATWTIGGTNNPSFTIAIVVAIQ